MSDQVGPTVDQIDRGSSEIYLTIIISSQSESNVINKNDEDKESHNAEANFHPKLSCEYTYSAESSNQQSHNETSEKDDKSSVSSLPIFNDDQERIAFEAYLASIRTDDVDKFIRETTSEMNEEVSCVNRTGPRSRTFVCLVCHKEFAKLHRIRAHCLIHLEKRQYSCPRKKCTFSSNTRGNLYSHMRIHTGNVYRCDLCSFTAINRQRLIEHKETHSQVVFVCSLCSVTSNTQKSLKDHVRRVHPTNKEYLATFYRRLGHLPKVLHVDQDTRQKTTWKYRRCGSNQANNVVENVQLNSNVDNNVLTEVNMPESKMDDVNVVVDDMTFVDENEIVAFQKELQPYVLSSEATQLVESDVTRDIDVMQAATVQEVGDADRVSISCLGFDNNSTIDDVVDNATSSSGFGMSNKVSEIDQVALKTTTQDLCLELNNSVCNVAEQDCFVDGAQNVNNDVMHDVINMDASSGCRLGVATAKCDLCTYEGIDFANLGAHIEAFHPFIYICTELDGFFPSVAKLREHLSAKHDPSAAQLDASILRSLYRPQALGLSDIEDDAVGVKLMLDPVTSVAFKPLTLLRWSELRSILGNIECVYCGFLCKGKDVLSEHNAAKHANVLSQPVIPLDDDINFSLTQKTSNVIQFTVGKNQVQCAECALGGLECVLDSDSSLFAHRKDTHPAGNHCPICPKRRTFSRWDTFRAHMAVVHDTKSVRDKLTILGYSASAFGTAKGHVCPYCLRVFYRSVADLTKHILIHEEVKPFKCHLCHYAGRSRNNLNVHLLTHSDKREYKCEICGKECTSRQALVLHQRLHETTPRFQCDSCSYSATQIGHYKRHLETHYVRRRYSCAICGYMANTRQFIKTHYTRQHCDVTFDDASCLLLTPRAPPTDLYDVTKAVDGNGDTSSCMAGITGGVTFGAQCDVYRCTSCDYTFGNVQDMRRHLRRKHQLSPESCSEIFERKSRSIPSTGSQQVSVSFDQEEISTFSSRVGEQGVNSAQESFDRG